MSVTTLITPADTAVVDSSQEQAGDARPGTESLLDLVAEALDHPRPLNLARTRMLIEARADVAAADLMYRALIFAAGECLRTLGGDGFGYCLEHTVDVLRGMGLVVRDSEHALDVAMGHVARVAVGLPPSDHTETTASLVACDPVRAVAVAYALCRADDWAA